MIEAERFALNTPNTGGQSLADVARRHDVTRQHIYQWRRELRAEATHRHTASIRDRMSAAKLPVAKDIDAFGFDGTPVNEGLVRSRHAGSFLPAQRNIVLVGGTGTGKTHLAIAITANVTRAHAQQQSPGSNPRWMKSGGQINAQCRLRNQFVGHRQDPARRSRGTLLCHDQHISYRCTT